MCIARSLLASSMNGRFSSSVNSFHSAPIYEREKHNLISNAHVGVDEIQKLIKMNQRWDNGQHQRRAWVVSTSSKHWNLARECFEPLTSVAKPRFVNNFGIVSRVSCFSSLPCHQHCSNNSKNCFNWKMKMVDGSRERENSQRAADNGEKFFTFFSQPRSQLRKIFHYRMTMLFFVFFSLPSIVGRWTKNWKKSH